VDYAQDDPLKAALGHYQLRFEGYLKQSVERWGEHSQLWEACRYALFSGGKRFRPVLVMLIAEAVGKGLEALDAAVAIECFHTASLIADDLPCMDDDDERRDRPAVHRQFDQAIALLASYTLISEGYGAISRNAELLNAAGLAGDRACTLAIENVCRNVGLKGATGGQFLDIYSQSWDLSGIRRAIQQKTGTLFEIAFVLGWLFGGGDYTALPTVIETANHYGIAFQIADDFGDVEQDAGKGRSLNFVSLMGRERAQEEFEREEAAFEKGLHTLGMATPVLAQLGTWLRLRIAQLSAGH
jgi:geranylgeranyl diphosphate synthase type II